MDRRTKRVAAIFFGLAAIGAGTGVAIAAGNGDQALSGGTYRRATAAALEHLGGGTVTDTEVGDGGASYEVEIRLPDGRQVEVQLGENFDVIGSESDDDGRKDVDGSGNDD